MAIEHVSDMDDFKRREKSLREAPKINYSLAYLPIIYQDDRHYKFQTDREEDPDKEIKNPCYYCEKRDKTFSTRGVGTEKVPDYVCGFCSETIASKGHKYAGLD